MKYSHLTYLLPVIMYCGATYATPFVFSEWQNVYINSTSDAKGCQLCHQRSQGGSPWNSYGWDIRKRFKLKPAENISGAIEYVSNLDSDFDGVSNFDEIVTHKQPGWSIGSTNSLFSDVTPEGLSGFYPPLNVDPFPQKIAIRRLPISLEPVATGFTQPIGASIAPIETLSDQLFVADRIGVIWRVNVRSGSREIYIDLRDQILQATTVLAAEYDERGLLGIAFHPDFQCNGRLYIYSSQAPRGVSDFPLFSSDETSVYHGVINELVIQNPKSIKGRARFLAHREVLRLDQVEFRNTGGGMIFDRNHMMMISVGDQGLRRDSDSNARNLLNPYGAILRIDPTGSNSASGNYGIPIDNPFINDVSKLDEIYAYGFRNPKYLSYDSNGEITVTDSGQSNIEEVNLVQKGANYGWSYKEGRYFYDETQGFNGVITAQFPIDLPTKPLINPVLEYDRDEGNSIVGGHLYRGGSMPSLTGKYLFADFNKRVFVGDTKTGYTFSLDLPINHGLFSVVKDANHELYLLGSSPSDRSNTTGVMLKLASTLPKNQETCFPIIRRNRSVSIACL